MPLPKKYKPADIEAKWQKTWEENHTYKWHNDAPRDETYVIDTPPPTVSGLLHMGHIFSYTQADFVARFQRMNGKDVFYPMGFDDNGLPTERLVEKTKKKRAVDMGREAFIELCMDVSEEARGEFRALFESVALSVDWDQEYHTISERSRTLSQMSFIDLYHKDKAYRKLQPMFWDPVDQTAIAQAEVEDKELKGTFSDIRFTVKNSEAEFVIGTTRPELIAACVAIFYHPDDARYKHLEGAHAITPLFNVEVPILSDEAVEIDKGTGIMMCCTFGDEADILKWRTHDLPARLVLDNYAKLRLKDKPWLADSPQNVLEALEGLRGHHQDKNVPNARTKTLEMLADANVLVKSDEITHAVPCAERSGSPLEIIPTNQWFIRILDQKEQLKQKAEQANWYPHYMKTRIDQWIDGLSWDWCVSRQRYFGVPFPVWYSKRAGEEGKVILATAEELPVNPLVDAPKGYSMDEVEPEADVMDTWATSSVSPQLNSYAITDDLGMDNDRHAKLFPADLRPQAHEIIRTWAFYTLAKAHLHEDVLPWKNLMISGWCLASDKTKMSKSKGNVVTPVKLIEEKGADAVRFWASTSKLGTDTAFSEDVLKVGHKLVTKLFNASKFAAIQLEHLKGEPSLDKVVHPIDKWMLTRASKAISKATVAFEKYEYAAAREAAEDVFWNDFCDNYLELVKARAYDPEGKNPEGQQSAVVAIYHALEIILKLFAPFVPHVTEELYSHIFAEKHAAHGSLHARHTWPKADDYMVDENAEAQGKAVVSVLNEVRKVKADANVSIKWPLDSLKLCAQKEAPSIDGCFDDLAAVTNARSVQMVDECEGVATENAFYKVQATLSKESDAA